MNNPPSSSDAKSQEESPPKAVIENPLGELSTLRRYFLLVLFCLAQFMDAFNSCALFAAIPTLTVDLGFEPSEVTWIVSATQLTFASFLLIVSFSNPLPAHPRECELFFRADASVTSTIPVRGCRFFSIFIRSNFCLQNLYSCLASRLWDA